METAGSGAGAGRAGTTRRRAIGAGGAIAGAAALGACGVGAPAAGGTTGQASVCS
jgi:hypothetical protein